MSRFSQSSQSKCQICLIQSFSSFKPTGSIRACYMRAKCGKDQRHSPEGIHACTSHFDTSVSLEVSPWGSSLHSISLHPAFHHSSLAISVCEILPLWCFSSCFGICCPGLVSSYLIGATIPTWLYISSPWVDVYHFEYGSKRAASLGAAYIISHRVFMLFCR